MSYLYNRHHLNNDLASKTQVDILKSSKPTTDDFERSLQSIGSSLFSLLEKAAAEKRFGPPSSVMFAEKCPFRLHPPRWDTLQNQRTGYKFRTGFFPIDYTHSYPSATTVLVSTLSAQHCFKRDSQQGLDISQYQNYYRDKRTFTTFGKNFLFCSYW